MEPISSVLVIANQLISLLGQMKQIHDQWADNKGVVQEIVLFTTLLEKDLEKLKLLAPHNNSSKLAVENLQIHLEKARGYVEKCLKMGYFKSLWSVNSVKMKLARIRENLLTDFQTTLQYITMDVSLNGQREMEEFQQRLHRSQEQFLAELDELGSNMADLSSNINILKEMTTSMREEAKESAVDARSERQAILQLLTKAAAKDEQQEQKFSALISAQMKQTKAQTTEVMANLQQRPADDWSEDPITTELMCDPIKASDGRTYDRWTIIDHNEMRRHPYDRDMTDFGILVDDINVRSRLFEQFPQQEELFRSRRQKYRQEALDHVHRGQFGDALVKLNHVLQWNGKDEECTAKRDYVQSLILNPQALQVNVMQLRPFQVPVELQTRRPGVSKGDYKASAFSTPGDLKVPLADILAGILASTSKEEPSPWMHQQLSMDTHQSRQGHSQVPANITYFQDDKTGTRSSVDSGSPNTHEADEAAPSYIVLCAVPLAGEQFELVDVSKWAEFGIGVIVRGEVQYLYAEGPKVLPTVNSYRDSVGIARTVWQVVGDAPVDGTALSSMSFALQNKDTGARLYYDFDKGCFYGAWVESNTASRLTHWRLWRSSKDVTRYKLQYIQGPRRGQFAVWGQLQMLSGLV